MINVLKTKVDQKFKSLSQFVNHAQELITTYEKNVERAFSHCGDWRLLNSPKFDNESKSRKVLKEVKESLCSLFTFLVNNNYVINNFPFV